MNVAALEIVNRVKTAVTLIKLGMENWSLNALGDSAINSMNSIVEFVQKLAVPGAAVCAVGIGVMFFMGRKGAETAKPWIMYVLIGMFCIFGAAEIATFFKTSTGF